MNGCFMAVFQGVEVVIKGTVPKQNVVILSVCYYGAPETMDCQVLF